MISSTEFTQAALSFDYFKVESVKFIFRSMNFTGTDKAIQFRFRWGIEATTGTELFYDDMKKIVPPVLPRPRVFTFAPPPITVSSGGTNPKYVSMNEYQTVNNALYPVSFGYYNPLSTAIEISVEWKVRFRGASSHIDSQRVGAFLAAIENTKLSNDKYINNLVSVNKNNNDKFRGDEQQLEDIREEEEEKPRSSSMPAYNQKQSARGIPYPYQGLPPK
jgi:hypothetical protein